MIINRAGSLPDPSPFKREGTALLNINRAGPWPDPSPFIWEWPRHWPGPFPVWLAGPANGTGPFAAARSPVGPWKFFGRTVTVAVEKNKNLKNTTVVAEHGRYTTTTFVFFKSTGTS